MRWISCAPPLGLAAQPHVARIGDAGDHDHAQGQRIAQVGVVQHIAAYLRKQQDGHNIQGTACQGIGGGHRAKGIGKQQQHGTQNAGPQNRQGHIAPVLECGAAQAVARFSPLAFDALQRGRDDQHHQGDLKIQVGQRQPGKAQDTEAGGIQVEPQKLLEQYRHQPHPSQCGQEGKCQGHPGKVGGHPGKGHECGAYPCGQLPQHRRPGQQEAQQPAPQGGRGADLDADPVGAHHVVFQQTPNVGEGEATLGILKGPHHEVAGGQNQKQQGEQKEGENPDPIPVAPTAFGVGGDGLHGRNQGQCCG
ncbi:MAG: hypothetical protein A2W64_00700 [Candidatus Zambryskibacteria bacterium RIFCSPLOWO2_02_39_10]|nr:MAG: hypothetical protein A2W64_00700 [Candidatus Zambryskibacteria bacterium RIFCSPLOWO2_02_39_10]